MEEVYTTFDLERLASDAELKDSILEMLLAFDAFCKEHDLTYYLSGGTLLGAVRHGGFIPWDDDIDVNMPRPDCEKLMQLSGGKIGKFTLVPPNNLPLTFAYHWKLYGEDILVSKRVNGKKANIGSKIYPTFMDIFPIEGLPDDYDKACSHYDELKKIKQKARFQTFLPRYRGRNPIQKIKYTLARIYFRFFDFKNYHDEVINRAKKYPYETSDHVGVMMTDVHGIVERVEKSDYSPVIPMEFEGETVQAPAGFHTYLKQLYGEDYMTVLPPHKQFSRHSLAPFKRKKSAEIDPSSLPGPVVDAADLDPVAEQAAYHVARGQMEEVYSQFDLERLASDAELKETLLELLVAFDAFCREHDLTYYLTGETLLGAVRHKGFVPWEDDLNVSMPRPDCEKLMQLSGGKIGKFTFVPPNNAARSFAYHWKLCSDDILVAKRFDGGKSSIGDELFPAFMDIFPIEGLPDSPNRARAHFRGLARISRKARRQTFLPRYRGRNPIRKLKYNLAQFYLQYFDVTNYHDEVINRAKKYHFETSEYVAVMTSDSLGTRGRMKKSDFAPGVPMEFEGKSFQCPAGFHTYLERLYGENYMTVSPPHRQFSRQSLVPFKRKKVAEIDPSSLLEVENDSTDQSAKV